MGEDKMKPSNVCSIVREVRSVALASAIVLPMILSAPAHAARTVRLDAGTVIPVRLNDPLRSDELQPGDLLRRQFVLVIRLGAMQVCPQER